MDKKENNWRSIVGVSLFVGGVLSLFASSAPDGLERVAVDEAFFDPSSQGISGLFPDYHIPGIANEHLTLALSGLLGTGLVFGLLFLVGRFFFFRDTRD